MEVLQATILEGCIMYWSKRFFIYRAITFWMPDCGRLMPVKRSLLRLLGVNVGKNVSISSGCRFVGNGKIVLHNNVILSNGVQIGGEGRIELGDGVKIAENNVIRANGSIIIGNRTEIYQSNLLMANGQSRLTIGSNCQIAHFISLKTSHHQIEPKNVCIAGHEKFTDISVGDGCWLCAGAIILPGVSVGDKCIIAAGAVVTRDVPSYSLVAGVPAVVKKNYNSEMG